MSFFRNYGLVKNHQINVFPIANLLFINTL